MARSGITFDTKAFEKAARQLEKTADENMLVYGRAIGKSFESYAKQGAGWVDRRGVARRGLTSNAKLSGHTVYVGMGGSAPNYKRKPNSSPDYMEYLEFGFGGAYAVIYPTVRALTQTVIKDMGRAALKKGDFSIRIQRDKAAARRRRARWYRMMRAEHGQNARAYKSVYSKRK